MIAGNEQYKEILFDFFFTIFSTNRLSAPDQMAACKLIESILLNLPGQVDSYLYRVLDVIRARLADEEEYKKPAHKVFLLEVIINAIYYNPVATLNYLEQSNFLQKFMQMWFNEADHFLRVHDKKLSILALMKIVELPPQHLPPTLQNDQTLKYLMKAMLTFFQTLPDAIASTLFWFRMLNSLEREEANELEEADGDSVAAEGEGEWDEVDSWSDTEDGGNITDEAQAYLDFLAQEV